MKLRRKKKTSKPDPTPVRLRLRSRHSVPTRILILLNPTKKEHPADRRIAGYLVKLDRPFHNLILYEHRSVGSMTVTDPISLTEARTGRRVGKGKSLSLAIKRFQDDLNRSGLSVRELHNRIKKEEDDKAVSYNANR